MVKGLPKKGGDSEKFRNLEDVFGEKSLEGEEVFFQDCFKKLSLGEVEEEDFSRRYVKTNQGYIYVDMSSGNHYVGEQNI